MRGPTLAALRESMMHSKILIYFTLYNTTRSGALSKAKRAQRSIMDHVKIWLAMHSSRSIHLNSLFLIQEILVRKKSSVRTSVPSCLRMSLSFPDLEFNKGVYNLYSTVYIGHPGYGQLTLGYLLISAT